MAGSTNRFRYSPAWVGTHDSSRASKELPLRRLEQGEDQRPVRVPAVEGLGQTLARVGRREGTQRGPRVRGSEGPAQGTEVGPGVQEPRQQRAAHGGPLIRLEGDLEQGLFAGRGEDRIGCGRGGLTGPRAATGRGATTGEGSQEDEVPEGARSHAPYLSHRAPRTSEATRLRASGGLKGSGVTPPRLPPK